jgi:hypothetical protein
VGDEMQTAQDAWSRVMGSSGASALDGSIPAGSGEGTEEEEESELSRLVTALGTTYCRETHGEESPERAGSGKQPNESASVDWYVRMIFATDEDDNVDAEEGEGEGEGEGGLSVDEDGVRAGDNNSSKAPKSAPATGSWACVKWAVAPTGASSVVDKMWKCDKCYVLNPWEQAKCVRVCGDARGGAGPLSGPDYSARLTARRRTARSFGSLRDLASSWTSRRLWTGTCA